MTSAQSSAQPTLTTPSLRSSTRWSAVEAPRTNARASSRPTPPCHHVGEIAVPVGDTVTRELVDAMVFDCAEAMVRLFDALGADVADASPDNGIAAVPVLADSDPLASGAGGESVSQT
jgi:hypothetical protein